mmetsp:Transcript_25705/g.53697  ORF Transcript_25705/g.53697 Transcript_25705/m.53697 type:complete len:321 (+) Transcript_25705:93-1055(+)
MDDVISTRVVNGNIDNKDEEDITPINIRGKIRGGTTATKMAILFVLLLLLIEVVSATATEGDGEDSNESSFSTIRTRINGIQSLLQSQPGMMLNMIIRVALAVALMINIDAFLKLVVTPILAASIIGAIAAPFTFFVGQALQPIVYSICFYGFDDPFVVAALEATGGKERLLLAANANTGGVEEWHEMGFFNKYFTRWCIKTAAGFIVGFAGLASAIPLVGSVFTALLAGWAVAWDMVYVPLAGIGRVGILRQGASVLAHFWEYYWFGFWAVLIEEIPIVGPVCHVYNVYSAAFFLERVYTKNENKLASAVEGLLGGKEL